MPAKISDILNALRTTETSLAVDGLAGGASGLMLATLMREERDHPLLIVAADARRAQELIDDIMFFAHPADVARITPFPEGSALPFSRLSPDPDDWADRLRVLHRISRREPIVIVASATALMRRLPPPDFIASQTHEIGLGGKLDPHALCQRLADIGYEDVGLVEDEGTFARRGGIVDLWPPTTDKPVRLELDDDRILSMRFFEPATQRSRGDLAKLTIIPARDFPFDADARSRAAHRVRERADEAGLAAHERRSLIEVLHEGIAFSGIETLMPLFHEKTSTFFDVLPRDTIVVVDAETDVESAIEKYQKEIDALVTESTSPERIVTPAEIVMTPATFEAGLASFRRLRMGALADTATPARTARVRSNAEISTLVAAHAANEDMLSPLVRRLREFQREGAHILFTCHTAVQAERIADLFRGHGVTITPFDAPFETLADMSASSVHLRIGRPSAGFQWMDEGLVIITDEEIFGHKKATRAPAARPMEPFSSLAELTEGDLIVHEQHGIGRFVGLKHMTVGDEAGDYLLIEYLGEAKLYLPVYRLNLVGRYIGSSDAAPMLDRLGGTRWTSLRKKVSRAIQIMARELVDLYAARKVFPGFAFSDGGAAYEEFCAAFPYDETPDQERSIRDVMNDMGTDRPMDRLVCGDVGYGKTEVAMRAAFRAALAGKQVAVLVPTTVLALQHFETFKQRFSDAPLNIAMLSRFVARKESAAALEGLARGTVDIIIGTHRLLQKDMRFRDLGLLIIDEEHRFGVRHKERIKKLRATVDVMTLTATPIPRTLNLSLAGIRDISIINTPPADRQAIATYVSPFDEGVIGQAVRREMARGGQVFFVHNRVQTIDSMRQRLQRLIPEARIIVGHGQMKESDLEGVMIDFLAGKADVLLCTTIIESGLDITRANTIIIHRADTFGLAQLYQLRGRVGRSNQKAHAYLLTPPEGTMTAIAKKRLTVLKRFTELGSGFQIAMHDLEFRGAGNILGSAQSGHIAAMGYELYAKLLDRAIRRLKGATITEEIDPELHLKVAAFLPEDYVADPGTRIDLYRRLAGRESAEEIEALGEEMTDRFGVLPTQAQTLLGLMEVRILARQLRLRQIVFDGRQFSCQLDPSCPLATETLLELIAAQPQTCRLIPPDRLLLLAPGLTGDNAVISAAKKALSRFAERVSDDGL